MPRTSEKKSKKVGVKDIAREAGVAISTVSHALNGTAPITEEIRGRVIEAARRLGYLHQRRLRAAISALQSVIVVLPASAANESDTNLVTWTILESVRQICGQRGIRVIPFVAPTLRREATAIRALAEQEDADAIVVFLEDHPDFVRILNAARRPVVLVNGVDPAMIVDCVTPANRFGARQATEYLLDLGHRRIMHLTFGDRGTIQQRLTGYIDALRGRDIAVDDDLIVRLPHFEPSFAEQAIASWLDNGGRESDVTAIFCAADNIALGALRALIAGDVRVPEEISVLGFDDVVLCELANPPLSSMKIPLRSMAEAALELAEQRLVAGRLPRPSHRLELGCEIVARASCAPPRS